MTLYLNLQSHHTKTRPLSSLIKYNFTNIPEFQLRLFKSLSCWDIVNGYITLIYYCLIYIYTKTWMLELSNKKIVLFFPGKICISSRVLTLSCSCVMYYVVYAMLYYVVQHCVVPVCHVNPCSPLCRCCRAATDWRSWRGATWCTPSHPASSTSATRRWRKYLYNTSLTPSQQYIGNQEVA